jgi:hypothetical protein
MLFLDEVSILDVAPTCNRDQNRQGPQHRKHEDFHVPRSFDCKTCIFSSHQVMESSYVEYHAKTETRKRAPVFGRSLSLFRDKLYLIEFVASHHSFGFETKLKSFITVHELPSSLGLI